jgi:hypothetical protein
MDGDRLTELYDKINAELSAIHTNNYDISVLEEQLKFYKRANAQATKSLSALRHRVRSIELEWIEDASAEEEDDDDLSDVYKLPEISETYAICVDLFILCVILSILVAVLFGEIKSIDI